VDAVLRAGAQVFIERGYDGATMDDVAAALGITKSTVYHHVSSKEDILGRALRRALDELERLFDGVAAVGGPAADQLARIVRGSVAVLVAELPNVTLLLRVRGNSAEEREALARRRALDTRLANLVIQAQQAGDVRADLDAHLLARLIFGTVNSLTEWYRPGRGTEDSARLADAVSDLIFRGLR
jgi:AcrR family transcriptional regulator